jgi:uncharacterized protein
VRAASLLFTAAGALRAPWRLLVFLAAALVGMYLAFNLAYPLVAGPAWFFARWRLEASSWLTVLALVLAHLAAFRLAGGGWATVGLTRRDARPRVVLPAAAVGALAIAVPSLLLLGVGWLRGEPAPDGSSLAHALRLLVVLAPAALWEELLFRGYAFAVVREAAGDGAALLLSAATFGLLHLQNAGANLQAVGQVVFAGVWLGGVLLATGSLWAAWAAHLAWNWTMAALLHAPVSGIGFAAPDWRLADAGPDWATGGAWGPEAGLGATLGMAVALLYYVNSIARPAGREER